MNIRKVALVAALLALSTAAFANTVVYNQSFDGTGNAYSSQNDPVSFGPFAQVYDNFKLGAAAQIIEAKFTGEYFNPPSQGQITNFYVAFYADAGGQPGALLADGNFPGTGGETFLGNVGGFPTYTYDIVFGGSFNAAANTQYWFSVQPTVAFPPQWGWSSGNGPDALSYQDFFGARSSLAADMAFTLLAKDQGGVPEPGTLVMLGTGVLGVAGAIRRKLV